MTDQTLKIGTRGSPLALTQAGQVQALLEKAFPEIKTEIVTIRTSGDWKPEHGEKVLPPDAGGKGLFVKEIEQALINGDIDCAVHSLKDVPAVIAEGLAIKHVLPAEDPRDAFLSLSCQNFNQLPEGAVVGTSSPRRQAIILSKRPDLKVSVLRGNVQTRIEKMKSGQVDATLLAMAGLNRLGINEACMYPLEIEDMLPACGQGVIAIQTRSNDQVTHTLLDDIHCKETGLRVNAERKALYDLQGSCHTPIALHAFRRNDQFCLQALVASLDGRELYQAEGGVAFSLDEAKAEELGRSVAEKLKASAPERLFNQ